MPRKLGDPKERFWKQVKQGRTTECWPWVGPRNTSGYGVFGVKVDGRWTYRHASRWALEFTVGNPGDGRWALHLCDNPSCCNPTHLYWGTPTQNVSDMWRRGRAVPVRRGQHGMARLTEEDVAHIRASEEPARALASEFSVSARHIRKIRAGTTWVEG